MAAVLHVLKSADTALARVAMDRELAAGDRVTVALLPGAVDTGLPAGIAIHRVPDDLAYAQLLDLIFAADHVVSW